MICPKCNYDIPARTSAQNRKLWPLLHDLSQQIPWIVDGHQTKLDEEGFKEILTASLRKHQRAAQGIDGGIVFLGARTSKMSKEEFSMLIELIYHFGSERGVKWSDPALKAYEKYREAA